MKTTDNKTIDDLRTAVAELMTRVARLESPSVLQLVKADEERAAQIAHATELARLEADERRAAAERERTELAEYRALVTQPGRAWLEIKVPEEKNPSCTKVFLDLGELGKLGVAPKSTITIEHESIWTARVARDAKIRDALARGLITANAVDADRGAILERNARKQRG